MKAAHQEQTDTQLLALLDTEPDRAMEALVERYSALICHVAGKYLPDSEDVKECVNDAFAQVYLHRSEFDPRRGSLALWIGTIARNRAVSMYRKRSRDLPLPEEAAEAVPAGPDMAADREQAIDVERAIAQLSETDQQIIRMKYYGGMTLSEIARSLHIPYETVKKRHTRSIKSLRRLLLILLAAAILLALAACGIIQILRRFGVLPGYGVTSDPAGSSYVLEETAVYQEGIVTIEIDKACLFNDRVMVEYTVMLDKDGYDLPEYDDKGEPTWREMTVGQLLCDGSGKLFRTTNGSTTPMFYTPREGYLEEFTCKTRARDKLEPKDLAAIRSQKRVELSLEVNLRCDGVDYGALLVPFRLVRTQPEDLEDFAYLYDEKTGGVMLESHLEGDTLTLDVFSISNGCTRYCPSLTKSLYYTHLHGIEAEPDYPPVTIVGEDGTVYTGESGDFIGEFYSDSAVFLFQGVTPGTYTLTLPYVHLLVNPKLPPLLVWNLRDGTFSGKKVRFPGGTLQTVAIRELDTPHDRTMARSWEVSVRCEMDDPEMTAVEGAFNFTFPHKLSFLANMMFQYYVLGNNEGSDAGGSFSVGELDEDSGNLIYTVSVNDEGLEVMDLTRVECFPADSYLPLCVRWDHPIELEFEVTE